MYELREQFYGSASGLRRVCVSRNDRHERKSYADSNCGAKSTFPDSCTHSKRAYTNSDCCPGHANAYTNSDCCPGHANAYTDTDPVAAPSSLALQQAA